MKHIREFCIIVIVICCMLLNMVEISHANEKNTKTNNHLESEVSVTNALKEERNIGFEIIKAAGISFFCSTILCIIIVSKHKPVKIAKTANNYLDENRIDITRRDDIFIEATVDKQLK